MLHFTILATLAFAGTVLMNSQPGFRLSGVVIPKHYRLEIILPDISNSNFHGQVWIKIECVKPTPIITLHIKNLKITMKGTTLNLSVHKEHTNEEIQITETFVNSKNDLFTIELMEELKQGMTYTVHLPYEGRFNGEGLSKASYEDTTDGSKKKYAITSSKLGARSIFPCFDEPAMRATFSIKVGHQKNLKAVSNMPASSQQSTFWRVMSSFLRSIYGGICKLFKWLLFFQTTNLPPPNKDINILKEDSGLVWEQFLDTPPLSPHQLALVVIPLDMKLAKKRMGAVTLRLWAQTPVLNQLEKDTRKVVSLIPPLAVFFKDYFALNFPLPKLDFIVFPESGYIPHYGVIVASELMVLSPKLRLREINRLAHDIASHWLGDLVSIKWWSDLWYAWALEEYMATLALDRVIPEWYFADRMLLANLEMIYKQDEEETPVYSEIDHPDEIFDKYFTNMFLEKGPALMHMVHKFLGDKVFQQGLKTFISKFRGRSANHNDLWQCLTEQAHKAKVLPRDMTVQNIMLPWLTQTGFPLVTVTRSYETTTATVTQTQFTKHKGQEEAEDSGNCWWVPLSHFSSKDQHGDTHSTQPKHWLSCDQITVSFETGAGPNDWIIFNTKLAGIYRVNYDVQNWKLIANALKGSGIANINVLNRIQLLTDALDLAQIGALDYKTAFKLVSYLHHETSHLPWKVTLERLKSVKDNLFRTEKKHIYKNFLQALLTPAFDKFKDLLKAPKEAENKYKKLIIKWACEFDVKACSEESRKIFINWKNSQKPEKHPLDKDVRRMAYCKGVEMGGVEDWQFLQEHFTSTEDSAERKHILNGLSCTSNVDIIKRYLEWSIAEDSPVPSELCFDVFRKVTSKEAGYKVAWDFLLENRERILNHAKRSDAFAMFVGALADKIVTDAEKDQLRAFLESNVGLLETPTEIEEILNPARERLLWLRKNYEPIIEAVENSKL